MERDIKKENMKIKSPTILAILIYAYAREYMYENFITKIDFKYGMDTDSLFFRAVDINKISSNLFGNMPGQVKIELDEGACGIYVSKKVYANYVLKDGIEEIIKFRFKGVGLDDKYVPESRLQFINRLLTDRNYIRLSREWDNLPSAYSINMLREMLNKNQISILSSQLNKSFRGSINVAPFNIRGKYIIKTFPSQYNLSNNDLL